MRAQAREHLTHARARCASTDRRARETREQIEARARGARARPTCAREPRCARVFARASVRHARAQISSPKVDLVSLFAIWRAYLRARVSDGALLARLARARLYLLARLARARACRCSRTSRAHVLNARALALRTPQLVRHHIWIHMFWIKPIYIYIYINTNIGIIATVSIWTRNITCHPFCGVHPESTTVSSDGLSKDMRTCKDPWLPLDPLQHKYLSSRIGRIPYGYGITLSK